MQTNPGRPRPWIGHQKNVSASVLNKNLGFSDKSLDRARGVRERKTLHVLPGPILNANACVIADVRRTNL